MQTLTRPSSTRVASQRPSPKNKSHPPMDLHDNVSWNTRRGSSSSTERLLESNAVSRASSLTLAPSRNPKAIPHKSANQWNEMQCNAAEREMWQREGHTHSIAEEEDEEEEEESAPATLSPSLSATEWMNAWVCECLNGMDGALRLGLGLERQNIGGGRRE